MNEVPLMSEAEATFSGPSAGALLRQAREAAGLHIGALAVSLKVPVRKIEALEADRVDLLPDAVFARALASSICRTLKVNANPVLARLPQGLLPKLKTVENSLNATYQGSGVSGQSTLARRLSRPFVVIGLLLVAGAAFLLVMPMKTDTASEKTTEPIALPVPAVSSLPLPSPASVPNVAGESTGQKTPSGDLKLPEGTGEKAAQNAGQAVAAGATVSASMATEAKAPVSTPEIPGSGAEGVVVFSARGTSWIEVTDAAGVVQLRKTLSSGETAGASGLSPLKVVVGRVDSISLRVRGKEFDLAAVARDNVARFEVR